MGCLQARVSAGVVSQRGEFTHALDSWLAYGGQLLCKHSWWFALRNWCVRVLVIITSPYRV
jgi:hypothetical protein